MASKCPLHQKGKANYNDDDDKETVSASFPILSANSGGSSFLCFRTFSVRKSHPNAYETSSELHPAFRSESEKRSAFTRRASITAWLSRSTISPSKNPDGETLTISEVSDSLQPPALKTDPIRSMYWLTHFGTSGLGKSKYCSGDSEVEDEEWEFLRRLSMAASLQNSTQRGLLPPVTASRLLLEKLNDEPAEISSIARISELRNRADSRSKKSERSNPQQ
ncbi:unnamed protein product [Cuscuta epithymum]|uniref:Uncharacterized protein n=1 Tax=Cuscuta epithymum TaxID=186058 RepID=A0AAV0EPX0_9ASTE|nr:unnamed protein product [Cuscuta epithymum]